MARTTGLTSANLKSELWDTLVALKNKKTNPSIANAVAAQSREIMRVVNAEIKVAALSGRKPTVSLIAGK